MDRAMVVSVELSMPWPVIASFNALFYYNMNVLWQ